VTPSQTNKVIHSTCFELANAPHIFAHKWVNKCTFVIAKKQSEV
jgi:hypothetical protein